MKKRLLSCCLLAAISISPVSAEVKLSEKLTKIAGHLGEGGAHFSVTDSGDDLKDLAVFLDQVIGALPDTDLPPGFKLESLFGELGLYALQGSGQSAHQKGGLWHNRSFFLTDGDHEGMLSLLGKKAGPTVAHEFAPAGADLILETSLDLREVEGMARKLAIISGPEGVADVEKTFSEKLGASGMTLAGLFADLTVRGTLVFWLDEEKTFKMGPESSYPVPHFAARLDNAAIVWSLLIAEMSEMGELVKEGDEVKFIPDESEMESPFGLLTPHFVWNPDKKQLFFSLTEADLAACRGKGARVTTDLDFQTATEGFPEASNGLAYFSRDFLVAAVAVGKDLSRDLPPEAGELVVNLTPYFETLSRKGGYAGAFAVEEDGFLFVANTPVPVKGGGMLSSLSGVATVATLAGIATPLILRAQKAGDDAQKGGSLKAYAGAQLMHRQEYGEYANSVERLVEKSILTRDIADELGEAGVEITVDPRARADSSMTIIGVAPSSQSPGSVLVARADGSVSKITAEAFEARMKKQEEE